MWNGLSITLVDTAGLRDTVDIVEQEGIKRSKTAQAEADLTLYVIDAVSLQKSGVPEFPFPLVEPEQLVV